MKVVWLIEFKSWIWGSGGGGGQNLAFAMINSKSLSGKQYRLITTHVSLYFRLLFYVIMQYNFMHVGIVKKCLLTLHEIDSGVALFFLIFDCTL